MQFGEEIAFGQADEEKWKCPFDHTKKKVKNRDNVMPKWEKNDATKLKKSLKDEHIKPIPIGGVKGKDYKVQYTAHHLVPGNESWPKTNLLKWVDNRKGHINAHIGYDVNAQYNGVSLPGNSGISKETTGKKWRECECEFKKDYAFKSMNATWPTRQFHDRHAAYSEFVVGVLNKVAEKLNNKIKKTKYPGCCNKSCAGKKKQNKPYDPPIYLKNRLNCIALRLEGYLVKNPREWKLPVYTSRFALMYKENILEKDARKILKQARSDAKNY